MSTGKGDAEKARYWNTINEAARGGISIRGFCHQRRLREGRFYWWQHKLRASRPWEADQLSPGERRSAEAWCPQSYRPYPSRRPVFPGGDSERLSRQSQRENIPLPQNGKSRIQNHFSPSTR